MTTPLLELHGTAEEIKAQVPDFAGMRLHVIVLPADTPREPTSDAPPQKRSITETLLSMAEEMPPEERARMPADLAAQHDHYIYGWPKR